MLKNVIKIILSFILIFAIYIGYKWCRFIYSPLNVSSSGLVITIEPGYSLSKVIRILKSHDIVKNKVFFRLLALYYNAANKIQAGEYCVKEGMLPGELLQDMINGRVIQYPFTIVAGWRFEQLIQALHETPKIQSTLADKSFKEIMQIIAQQDISPEAMFWPDTYFFTAGTTDLAVLQRAYNFMQDKLNEAWQFRDPQCILKNSYKALILASILEKEASIQQEYYEISGVYQRRLIKRMRLQADPTVIYAISLLKKNFKAPLRKADLRINSPYNTYRNYGLPPTPIAIPSKEALDAALHPAMGDALYFVARKDGSHVFSSTLKEHNAAVKFRDGNNTNKQQNSNNIGNKR